MITSLHQITITVANLSRAANFYGRLLGLSRIRESETGISYVCGDVTIEVTKANQVERPRLGEPVLGFTVADIHAVYTTLRDKGVYFIHPPQNFNSHSMRAAFTDPDGNRLELIQHGAE